MQWRGGRKCQTAQDFWNNSSPEPMTGCWLWMGGEHSARAPYGSTKFQGKFYKTHRLSYELAFGPIPEGACVLHHCDTHACVNPQHLYLGDPKQNMRDQIDRKRHVNLKKRSCAHGHPFDDANTRIRIRADRENRIERTCKTCANKNSQNWNVRKAG
jgi:HNH endonuclease